MISSRAPSRRARRPSRLGLVLTFCLLIGLLFWRLVMPGSSLWADLSALACVAALLMAVKAAVRHFDASKARNRSGD